MGLREPAWASVGQRGPADLGCDQSSFQVYRWMVWPRPNKVIHSALCHGAISCTRASIARPTVLLTLPLWIGPWLWLEQSKPPTTSVFNRGVACEDVILALLAFGSVPI